VEKLKRLSAIETGQIEHLHNLTDVNSFSCILQDKKPLIYMGFLSSLFPHIENDLIGCKEG
jgi:hypothetical protein